MSAPDEETALLGLAPVAPDRTLAYGAHPDQVVDLYGPWGGGRGPLVVLLHGGFWRAAYDRRHLSPLAAELAGRGLPVALAEYRRVGAGGGAPQTFEDVAAAVEAVAAEAAASGVDVDGGAGAGHGLVLIGHSAGGHLALLAAARPGTAVTRVLAVSPVADLARAHELGLSGGAVAELLAATGPDGDEEPAGGGPAGGAGFRERLAAADPLHHPPPAALSVTILHGTADPDVPPELSRRYAAAHPAATDLHELPGVGHYAPVTPGTAACRTLLDHLRPSPPGASSSGSSA